jgi:hypothetical protein
LLHIESREGIHSLYYELLDVQIFHVKVFLEQLAEIVEFLTSRQAPMGYTPAQHHQIVIHSVNNQLITRHMYKLGFDGIFPGVP